MGNETRGRISRRRRRRKLNEKRKRRHARIGCDLRAIHPSISGDPYGSLHFTTPRHLYRNE